MARAPGFSIILAAGKGTRMRSSSLHKVCFPVDGKPAINRAIDNYNACGIRHHIVVVGALAGQVVETVGGAFDNVHFVYQREQRGTADAAEVGLRAVDALASDADVLLVPGDRLIEPIVLEQLFHTFYSGDCDLAFAATPPNRGSGRVVQGGDGAPLAIAEMADVRQRRVLAALRARPGSGEVPSLRELERLMREGFSNGGPVTDDAKLEAAFGDLWSAVRAQGRDPTRDELEAWIPEERTRFEFREASGGCTRLTPDQVERAPLVNVSVYVASAAALRYALPRIGSGNAQRERYLTDIVEILSQGTRRDGEPFRLDVLRVTDPGSILGYNDPAELLDVEAHIRARDGRAGASYPPLGGWFRSIRDWREAVSGAQEGGSANGEALRDALSEIYGSGEDVLAERALAYQRLLEYGSHLLGDSEPVFLVRSPGRVNAMGRHIDHQGGDCNLMTIGYETLMLVRPRRDDRIRLFNLDRERFGDYEFSIADLVSDLPWDDWLSLVNSEKLSSLLRAYGGHWSQYVMAAVLRLQKEFTGTPLFGMDLVVSGNVPPAAGLSSSSSIVVGAVEAAIAVNALNASPAVVVDLCGEGEWFVGTRGGSADAAAAKLGRMGEVIRVGFFDFAIREAVPFPPHHAMVVCDSGIRAEKTGTARDQFNHRIACYRMGLALIRRAFPQISPLIEHLRDLNDRKLGLPLSSVYKMLLHLPEAATADELRQMLPDDELLPLLATHRTPSDGVYPIRGVVLFGLAECERSGRFAPLLRERRIDEIGRLMRVSHDGDRVASFGPDGVEEEFLAPTSNGYLLRLIEDLESGEPERVNGAQLHRQPGSYRCSLPDIDRMVDISTRVPGVAGAQLAGAGLGGCMMALAHADAVDALRASLAKRYYEPATRTPRLLVCRPIAGAGVLL